MAERMEFQSEAKQVLELLINSVYANPDIFVRELVSNASDEIDQLRIARRSDQSPAEYANTGRTAEISAVRTTDRGDLPL